MVYLILHILLQLLLALLLGGALGWFARKCWEAPRWRLLIAERDAARRANEEVSSGQMRFTSQLSGLEQSVASANAALLAAQRAAQAEGAARAEATRRASELAVEVENLRLRVAQDDGASGEDAQRLRSEALEAASRASQLELSLREAREEIGRLEALKQKLAETEQALAAAQAAVLGAVDAPAATFAAAPQIDSEELNALRLRNEYLSARVSQLETEHLEARAAEAAAPQGLLSAETSQESAGNPDDNAEAARQNWRGRFLDLRRRHLEERLDFAQSAAAAEIAAAHADVQSLSAKLNDLQSAYDAAVLERDELAALPGQIAQMQERFEQIEPLLQKASQLDPVALERDALRRRVEELEAGAAQAQTLQERLAKAEAGLAELDGLRGKLSGLEAASLEREGLLARLSSLELQAAEAEALRVRLAAAEAPLAELTDLRARLANLENAAVERDAARQKLDALQSLPQELESVRGQAAAAEAAAAAARQLLVTREDDVRAAVAEVNRLRDLLMERDALDSEAPALRARVADLEMQAREAAGMRARLRDAETRAAEAALLRGRIADLEAEARQFDEVRARLAELGVLAGSGALRAREPAPAFETKTAPAVSAYTPPAYAMVAPPAQIMAPPPPAQITPPPAAPPPAPPPPAAAEARPKGLDAPIKGLPDDLKMIGGVGPKIEATLHSLGIFHFDQIAAWTPAEVDWVDSYLRFRGRILRERWIEQARMLATGVATEAALKYERGEHT